MSPSASLAIRAGTVGVALKGTGLVPALGVVAIGGYAVYKFFEWLDDDDGEVVDGPLPHELNDRQRVMESRFELRRNTVLADTWNARQESVESRGMRRIIHRR